MKDLFMPYEQALALKELGFDEKCLGHFVKHYDKIKWILNSDDFDGWWTDNSDDLEVNAPLYQQAFRWFREKHDCHHTIKYNKKYIGIAYTSLVNFSVDEFNTYEEAERACLEKLIEIVKNK